MHRPEWELSSRSGWRLTALSSQEIRVSAHCMCALNTKQEFVSPAALFLCYSGTLDEMWRDRQCERECSCPSDQWPRPWGVWSSVHPSVYPSSPASKLSVACSPACRAWQMLYRVRPMLSREYGHNGANFLPLPACKPLGLSLRGEGILTRLVV